MTRMEDGSGGRTPPDAPNRPRPPLQGQPPQWDLPLARGRRLRWSGCGVMGILNVTPDSFSDGGRLPTPASVVTAAEAMLAAGASVLDVGGESTRPGATPVVADAELDRVLPALQAIRRSLPEAVVSIDTRKAAVADAALAAGADLVNDVSGLGDPGMAYVVRRHACAVVLMRHLPLAGDPVAACRAELASLLQRASSAGIDEAAIVLDPGLGFGDPPGGDVGANLALLRGVPEYASGRPVLVGASRKRFLGKLTGEAEPSRRVGGSVAAALLAAQAGAAMVRVHDVPETVQALRVAGLAG